MEYCKDCKLPDGACGKCRKEKAELAEMWNDTKGDEIYHASNWNDTDAEEEYNYFKHIFITPESEHYQITMSAAGLPSYQFWAGYNSECNSTSICKKIPWDESCFKAKIKRIWDKIKRIFNGK